MFTKRLMFVACLFAWITISHADAQQLSIDVVHFGNGSIVRGIIIEHMPNESLKIRTLTGNVMTFKMSSVVKTDKEFLQNDKNPGVSFILSLTFLGAGQLYNEQLKQAFVHWGLMLGSIFMVLMALEDDVFVSSPSVEPIFGIEDPDQDDFFIGAGIVIGLTNWLASVISAPISADRINQRNRRIRSLMMSDGLTLEPIISHGARGAVLSLRF